MSEIRSVSQIFSLSRKSQHLGGADFSQKAAADRRISQHTANFGRVRMTEKGGWV